MSECQNCGQSVEGLTLTPENKWICCQCELERLHKQGGTGDAPSYFAWSEEE